MKKLLTVIAAAIFIIYPSICFSSYIIHLKDGREFVTDRYYEEGDQIKFNRYGGVIGIQKDQVKEIEEIADVPEEKAEEVKPKMPDEAEKPDDVKKAEAPVEAEKAESTEQVKEQQKPEEVSEEEKKKAEQKKAAKIEAFLEAKRRIIDEINTASSAFKEAKERNDKVRKDEYWKKRLLLREELAELRKQVVSEHGGTLPPWWDSVR